MRPDYKEWQHNWIKINGEDVRDWGVRVLKLPPLVIATERIRETPIPGRPDPLVELTGEFDSKDMPVTLHIDNAEPMTAAYQLAQARTVEFSNDPGFVYDCTLSGNLLIPRQILNWHTFVLNFRCSPLKRLADEPVYTGGFLVQGTEPAMPTITLMAGEVPANVTMTIAGFEMTMQNVAGEIVIDCATEEVWNDGENISNYTLGRFPMLQPGNDVTATATGAEIIEVKPNFRWR